MAQNIRQYISIRNCVTLCLIGFLLISLPVKSLVYSDKVVGKEHQERSDPLKSQASTDEDGLVTNKGAINSFPLYFTAKAWFGTDKFKASVKGVLGTQIAGLKREGVVSVSDTDFGCYGG